MIYYGDKKFNQGVYGIESQPFDVRVILHNKANNTAIMLNSKGYAHDRTETTFYGTRKFGQGIYGGKERPKLLDVSWAYERVGGCGNALLNISLPYGDIDMIEDNTEVRIECRGRYGNKYETWYRGEIVSRERVLGIIDTYTITVQGTVMQLERVRIDNVTYTNQNTGIIIADIIDNYVLASTDIKRTVGIGGVQANEFAVDTITFNGTAMAAIRSLAELTGNAEFGVGTDREFYFKVRSNAVSMAYFIDGLQDISEMTDFSQIVNKFKLFGTSPFTRSKGDTNSQELYGQRNDILEQSAINTNDVADRYIDGYLTELKTPAKSINFTIGNVRERIEKSHPFGSIVFVNLPAETGYVLTQYQIERIEYNMSGGGDGLIANITGGKIKEDITDVLAYLDYRLNQLVDV